MFYSLEELESFYRNKIFCSIKTLGNNLFKQSFNCVGHQTVLFFILTKNYVQLEW